MAARQTPYIGSKLRLVSKRGIKYEGTLYTIDPTESTIALAEVRCLGTEDRTTHNQYARRNDVYEYVVFNAADIEEVVVYDMPRPIVQFASSLPYDPAIVKISHCRVPSEYTYKISEQDAFRNHCYQLIDSNMHLLPPFLCFWQDYPGSQGAGDSYQFWQINGRSQAPRRRKPKARRQGVNTGIVDYDFEKANKHFDESLKLGPQKKISKENEPENDLLSSKNGDGERNVENSTGGGNNNNTYYNKNVSFFDKISYNAIEKGRQAQANWYKEQAKNEQTFGEATVRSYRCYVNRRYAWGRDANNQPLRLC